MKPALGRRIWCYYQLSISFEEVGYIGKDSFIIRDWSDSRVLDSIEYDYDEYNQKWFASFSKAKTELIKQLKQIYVNCKIKFVKMSNNYYEIEIKEK